jgi:hypothetical protein
MTALNVQPGADQFNADAGWTGLLFSETARDGLVANPGDGQANATLLTCYSIASSRSRTLATVSCCRPPIYGVNADGSINLVSFDANGSTVRIGIKLGSQPGEATARSGIP